MAKSIRGTNKIILNLLVFYVYFYIIFSGVSIVASSERDFNYWSMAFGMTSIVAVIAFYKVLKRRF